MSLMGKLRSAEPHGKEAAWQGLARAYGGLEEAQTRIRRKMRFYPRTAMPIVTLKAEVLPPEKTETDEEQVA